MKFFLLPFFEMIVPIFVVVIAERFVIAAESNRIVEAIAFCSNNKSIVMLVGRYFFLDVFVRYKDS